MSGGHFDYSQSSIQYNIIEPLEEFIRQEKANKDSIYPIEIIKEFEKGIYKLKEAYIYTQRIDWVISGDDGFEDFLERLKEDYQEAGLDFENR